jgi:galactokinase
VTTPDDILAASGMDPATAARHLVALGELDAAAGDDPRERHRLLVPGRIEILGKHTDYAGGSSLTCASARCIRVVAAARDDGLVRIHEPDLGRYAALEAGVGASAAPGHWSNYAATVIRRVAMNAPGSLRGADLWLSSDLPRAAGMSSSSAFIVAVFLGLDAASGLRRGGPLAAALPDADALAGYLAAAENGSSFGPLAGERGVGTSGGSEDHVAILLSRAGHIGRYRYAPFRRDGSVEIPRHLGLVVGASGVTANKTGSARARYNRAAHLAREAVAAWTASTGEEVGRLGDLVERDPDAARRLAEALPAGEGTDALLRRVRHFRVEHAEVVPAAWEALSRGDIRAFGSAVDRSQHAAEDLLGNQVPETMNLARSARELGAVASSAFGAGFGGAVWAMVPRADAGRFLEAWRGEYVAAFPRRAARARFFVEPTGPGALRLDGRPVW